MVSALITSASVILLFVITISAQDLTDYKNLYTDVFASNSNQVLPRHNATTPLKVALTFYLMSLTNFDELQETIVILAGVRATWQDEGITWTPSSYSGIQYINLPAKNIWVPPITLANAVDILQTIGKNTNFNAMIQYNGTISLPMGGILSAKCKTDIYKFPYDTQTCDLRFVPWGFVENDIIFEISKNGINTDFYTPSSNWDLQDIHVELFSWNGYSTFQAFLTIKRQSLYYSVLVVCPSIMFSLLNPLVFLLPVDSGERIGLAMTILLSYAIFLTLVSAAIPASSNPMCFLLLIMIVTIVVSGGIVVVAIVSVAIYHRNNDKNINACWKIFATRFRWNQNDKVTPFKSNAVDKDVRSNKMTDQEVYDCTWKDVSMGLDTISTIISYAIILVIISVFFGKVST